MSTLSAIKEIPLHQIKEQDKLETQHTDSYLNLRTLMKDGASPEDLRNALNQYQTSGESALQGRVMPVINQD